jgi:membrane protein implicated in regulation of membrane protease activity
MLIVALVLAVVSLAALVTAVVTSNETIAWACIAFSALGVLLLIVDAVRDRNRRAPSESLEAGRSAVVDSATAAETTEVMAPVTADVVDADLDDADLDADLDDDAVEEHDDEAVEEHEADAGYGEIVDFPAEAAVEDHPDELVYDDPEHDLPSDDEPDYPIAAEEAAIHVIRADEPPDEQSYLVPDDPSYMVSESPTVTYVGSAEDSAIVIYSSETGTGISEDSEEPGGER